MEESIFSVFNMMIFFYKLCQVHWNLKFKISTKLVLTYLSRKCEWNVYVKSTIHVPKYSLAVLENKWEIWGNKNYFQLKLLFKKLPHRIIVTIDHLLFLNWNWKLKHDSLSVASVCVLQDHMVVTLSSLAGQYKCTLVDNPTQFCFYNFDTTRVKINKLRFVT